MPADPVAAPEVFVFAADDSLWSSNVPALVAAVPEKWIVTHIKRPELSVAR